MLRILLFTVVGLAAACGSRPTQPLSSRHASAPEGARPASPSPSRITIERDRMIVVHGAETHELADIDDLPDLVTLDQLLGGFGAGDELAVELADDAIYADLRAVLKTANLHDVKLAVGSIAVAAPDELPAADIPMFAVSEAVVAAGMYQASTPDPLVVSTPPISDEAVAILAARFHETTPAPAVVLLVIEPETSGVVVNRMMRALSVHRVGRAVFGARRAGPA